MRAVWLGIVRSPHVVYLILAVIFTSVFITAIPPMTTPDAPQHFTRAYAISVGKIAPSEQGPGTFGNSLADESTFNLEVGFQPTSDGYYLPQSIVAYAMGAEYATSPLAINAAHPGEAFVYENQTEGTSPIAYLPQVLALLIGRLFTDSLAALAYLQEVVLAIVWIAGMTVVIRIAPFGKWPLLLIALLPTQIQDSFQLGADVMTSLPFVFIAALLIRRVSCARPDAPGTIPEFTLMSILAIMATQAKVVMLPAVLLLLAYPLGFTYIDYGKGTFLTSLWKRLLGVIPAIVGILLWSQYAQRIGRGLHDVYIVAPDRLELLVSSPIAAFIDWLKSCAQWACNQFDYPGLICGLRSGDARIPGTIALAVLFIVVTMIFTCSSTPLSSASSATKKRGTRCRCPIRPATSCQIDHQYRMYHHCAGRSGSHSVVDVHHLDANRRIRITRRTGTIPASLPVRARNTGAAETVPCQRHADSRPMHRHSDHPVLHIYCGHTALVLFNRESLRLMAR